MPQVATLPPILSTWRNNLWNFEGPAHRRNFRDVGKTIERPSRLLIGFSTACLCLLSALDAVELPKEGNLLRSYLSTNTVFVAQRHKLGILAARRRVRGSSALEGRASRCERSMGISTAYINGLLNF